MADLVIDCSGWSTELLHDLADVGFPYPPVTVVDGERRRHFDRVPLLPQGYLALGAAMCAASGESRVAPAVQARILRRILRRRHPADPRVPTIYHRRAARAIGAHADAGWGVDAVCLMNPQPRPHAG